MSQKPTERSGQLMGSAVRAAEDGTITFPLSSEVPYQRYDGAEILDHSESACDLSWLNSGNAPLLDNHNRWDGVRSQIGVVTRAWLSDKRLYVTVRFSNRPEAQAIRQDIIDGIVRNVSVGYDILDVKRIDEKSYKVTLWKPSEASIVSVPADVSVGIGRSATATKMESDMTTPATQTTPVSGERKMPGVMTEAERGAAFETSMNEVRALAATHTMSDLGEAFIESSIRSGNAPSIEVFRGIMRSKLPEGVALRNTDLGLNPRETRRFSLLKLARAMADGASKSDMDAAAFEIEVSVAARDADEKAGKKSAGAYTVPSDVLASWGDFEVDGIRSSQVRNITTVVGASVIDTQHLANRFIDNLRNQSSVMRAGATMLPGLEGPVEIPGGNANMTAAWLATEDANVALSTPSFRRITLTPRDLGAFTDITRRMLQQTTIAMEAFVRSQITTGIVLEIDRAGLYGTGATGQPSGLNATAGIGSIAFAAAATTGIPTRDELIDMRKLIAATNRSTTDLGWIINGAMVGDLQKTRVDAGSGVFLLDNDASRLIGNAVTESNQIPTGPTLNDVWLGYWSDLIIGMWGSLDLDRDTAARFLSGGIRLRGIQTVDVQVQRVGSFARGT